MAAAAAPPPPPPVDDRWVALAHALADEAAAVTTKYFRCVCERERGQEREEVRAGSKNATPTPHTPLPPPSFPRSPLAVDAKADASPVTVADRQAEAAVRAALAAAAPGHACYGEEEGLVGPSTPAGDGGAADYMWVVDPIDGTKSFITGE